MTTRDKICHGATTNGGHIMSNNQPLDTVRIGRIKATIWENELENGGVFHSVTLARNYRDENNQWRETNSFSVDDMPRVRMATDRAFDSIYSRMHQLQQQKTGNAEDSEKELDLKEEKNDPPAKKSAKKKFAKKIEDERKGAAAER